MGHNAGLYACYRRSISTSPLLRFGRDHVSLARSKEEIGFEAVLAGVEVVVPPTEGEELGVVAALNDSSLLHDQDLVGAADGGEPVGDDEGGAVLHELRESGLDHGLGLGVERTGGLVEDEDARL